MTTLCAVTPGFTYLFVYEGKFRIGTVEKYVAQDNGNDYVVCKVGHEHRSFHLNKMKNIVQCDES